MRILMLSDHETQGGAAVAASRLAEGLAERHEVLRCVLNPDGETHPWSTRPLAGAGFLARQAFRLARRFLPVAWYRPGYRRAAFSRLKHVLDRFRPDVINVHNLHGGFERGWGTDLVDLCATHAPTVWTLHDMWSFTGRCAYAYDCRAFETGCSGACPTRQEYPALKPAQITPAWQERRDLMRRHANLSAVAPSRWLAREASLGLWKMRRVDVIPYGLPLELYRPVDRKEARRRLGLPLEGPIVLIAAHSLSERRKGADILPDVWPRLKTPFTLAAMGHGQVSAGEHIQVRPLGFIGEPFRQALAYSAADLLLHPAPVDNLPNVVLEAIACGTPVVGFDIGGMPDMVRAGESGWLAGTLNGESLAHTLERALNEIGGGTTLRTSCRALALREYALGTQARRYEELFEQVRASALLAA
ncbi:MAG: glycosyltransferase [Gemmataceae bacterium]